MTRNDRADGGEGGARDRGTGGTAPVARAVPVGLTVDDTTAVTATLSWSTTAPARTDHYTVYVDADRRAEAEPARTRVALVNLAPATIHTVEVTAVDGAATESRPATARVTTDRLDTAADEPAERDSASCAGADAAADADCRRQEPWSPRSDASGGRAGQARRATDATDAHSWRPTAGHDPTAHTDT